MTRTKLGSLLLICPLLACADDIAVLQPGTTSSGEDTTASTTGSSATSIDAADDSSDSSSGGPGCGDDHQDAGEECDGTDLAGHDCATLGPDFTGGTLACASNCTFDPSACFICGNSVIDGPEVCDGADLGGNGCTDLGGSFTGGVLGCDATCSYDTTACTNEPWPQYGELVITEIMMELSWAPWGDGWFEIYNPAPDTSFQLGGCRVESDGKERGGFTIDVDLVIGPGEYRVFATDSPYILGFIADYEWEDGDVAFQSYADVLSIECNDALVDRTSWDDTMDDSFPDGDGQSASLDPGSFNAMDNDPDANWCDGITRYGHHDDLGTPRYSNPVCGAGPVDYPIGSCRLQLPDLIVEDQGTDVTVLGRLFIAGLTDLSIVDDPAQRVIGSVGYGPVGTDPAVDATWTWMDGTPNPNYDPGSPGYEADHDEYHATFPVPGPGTYDYAYRFSGDGGTTFTYCDGQPAGSTDGYQPANAGHMTSNAVAIPSLYFSEYVEARGNSHGALEIHNPTAETANIDACELRFYFDGDLVAFSNIELAGTIAADGVLVVCDDDMIDTSFCDVLDPMIFFGGNDAIELECLGNTLDVIGQIGFDPGTEWLVSGVGTEDETLRRSCSVTAGDSNGDDAFDPSLEWATFPLDTFDDLGQYVCP